MHTEAKSVWEPRVYALILLLMAAMYLYAGIMSVIPEYGFDWTQFRYVEPAAVVASYLVSGLAIVFLLHRRPALHKRFERKFPSGFHFSVPMRLLVYAFFSVAAAWLFWTLRSNFINPDGWMFTEKLPRDVSLVGAHVTHDEMWELYIHSRFWFYTNARLEWSVIKSYQMLSCLAGGVFVFFALVLCWLLAPKRWFPLFALLVSGGYMQLFFGDAENYTMTATLVLIYLFTGYLFLQRRLSIVVPSVVLALAATFHLLAGWLGPSLLYLYWVARSRGQLRQVVLGVALAVLIVVGTLTFFHFNGLPIRLLFERSHALGHGFDWSRNVHVPTLDHLRQVARLLLLLYPPAILVIPMYFFGKIRRQPFNVFLTWALGFLLLFAIVWESWIGYYYDWNLFAVLAIPLGLLVGYNVVLMDDFRHQVALSVGLFATATLPSYAWIVANHYYFVR